ncbi:MAG: diphosphate--fructose-6-phosphate 1-phosphotransferase, partial [Candidatus Marinimicrobia bacterium]|nr:diphosphate--fructose-6-phosphate 1-phosphotransferase [Candidatus Neomarinimicrobiota bacterium]
MTGVSELHKARQSYQPKLPQVVKNGPGVKVVKGKSREAVEDQDAIRALFPKTYGMAQVHFETGGKRTFSPFNIGVILSGGQAPGGHNVIAGIFDALKACHPDSKLYGFLGGPSGLVENRYRELQEGFISEYPNSGGFDMIGSGRSKLEKREQYDAALTNCKALCIKALVIIGGDDSNTNAAVLAEYYRQKEEDISVIGVPKTIDGDLKNDMIEASFGFDTASKVYSELVGNIGRDANSAKKYWHIIKLMGRSASHIALECALRTHPNYALISEEVAEKSMTLQDIVNEFADIVAKRADKGDHFGIALIPEGLIEFIPEMKSLIAELNDLMAHYQNAVDALGDFGEKRDFICEKLRKHSAVLYRSLPAGIAAQLIMERDPHGNVQVSLIETEKLLVEMVTDKLNALQAEGKYKGKFKTHTHFFGYEGRCSFPSNFDADYTYALGYTAAVLAANGLSGYMSAVRGLAGPADAWIPGGIPMTRMMNMERRHGQNKPVIRKALVDLQGEPFRVFAG